VSLDCYDLEGSYNIAVSLNEKISTVVVLRVGNVVEGPPLPHLNPLGLYDSQSDPDESVGNDFEAQNDVFALVTIYSYL
jgi:hypothetical protein